MFFLVKTANRNFFANFLVRARDAAHAAMLAEREANTALVTDAEEQAAVAIGETAPGRYSVRSVKESDSAPRGGDVQLLASGGNG